MLRSGCIVLEQLIEENYEYQDLESLLVGLTPRATKSQKDLQKNLEYLTYNLSLTSGFERCGVWLYDQTKTVLSCQNLYSSKTKVYSNGQQIIISAFPSYFNTIKSRRYLAIENVSENILTDTFYIDYLKTLNIQSLINLQITHNGEPLGVLSLASPEKNKNIPKSLCLALIPFSDICAQWITGSRNSPKLHQLHSFNNEALLREVSYLCKKSEVSGIASLVTKSLRSFNTILNSTHIHALVFNFKSALLYSSDKNKNSAQINKFQAANLHKLSSQTNCLWVNDLNNLPIGLPHLLKEVPSSSSSNLAITSSRLKTKNSSLNFVLIIEYQRSRPELESYIKEAVHQINTAFAIVLEYADTKSILKESLSLAKGAFDGSNIGMLVFNKKRQVIRANTSIDNILNHDIGSIFNLIPSEYELISTGFKKSTFIQLPDGEKKYLYLDISKIESDSPDDEYYLLQLIDISKQKKAMEALKDQEQLFKNVIDFNPAFIFAKNLDGTFVLANRSVSEVYGTTPEGMIGKKDSDFNPNPEEVKKFRDDDIKVILGKKEIFIAEEKITDSQGKIRYLQTVKKPIFDPTTGKNLALGVSTDITERKLAEEKEKKWSQEIEHSQRLESLGLLAGNIAHDFKNLLQSIIGNCSLALRSFQDLKNETGAQDYLNKVLLGGEKATALCNQLLCYSGKNQISKDYLDITEIIRDSSTIFEGVIRKDVQITYNILNTPLIIHGDKTQLEQVIINLVTNAIEAASDGGKLVNIAIYPESTDKDWAVLEIKDNGIGIPEELKDRIFEPFYTTKRKGRGLGLAAVKGIVESHAGTIELTSEVGIGTTFKIHLPLLTNTKLLNKNSKDRYKPNNSLLQKHILVIDDEALSREVTNAMLVVAGAKTVVLTSAIEGISVLENAGRFDAVVLDVNMPHMSGKEAFKKIRSLYPNLPILLISGYTDPIIVETLIHDRFSAFLPKPYTYELLSEQLSILLKQFSINEKS